MRGRSVALLVALALVGCGGPPARIPLPPGEDYIYPLSQPRELSTSEHNAAEEAWKDVLSGNSARAEQAYAHLLSRHPGSAALETGLGYARLRMGRQADAGRSFESALRVLPEYVPALVGAGSVASLRGDPDAALEFYRRAQVADPRESRLRRRLSELKVQVTEKSLALARSSSTSDRDGAIAAYRVALQAAPELAQIRLELANLLASGGDTDGAVALLEEDPGRDREVLLKLGELERATHHLDKALETYHELTVRDPKDAEALSRAADVRKALEFEGMPEEYRRIYESPRLSRGELAALLAVKVRPLQRLKEGDPPVAVDISGSWAREHILKVLSLNVMDVYSNHTFQPGAIVRRGDLAVAVGRVLDLLHAPIGNGPQANDITSNDVRYEGVKRALGAGLMDLSGSGAFEAWRPVTGREAADVVEALVRLTGP